MDCPFCGAEMEQGTLQSLYHIHWLERPALTGLSLRFKLSDALGRCDRPVQAPYLSAFRCPACRKIIADY